MVKKANKEKFQGNVLQLAEKKLCKINKEGGREDLDKTLCTCVSDEIDIEESIEEFHDIMTSMQQILHTTGFKESNVK
jgi:hypothetical protein